MNKEDQKSNKKKVTLSIVAIFLMVDLMVLLIFLLHYCNKGNIVIETSSSNIESSTSEPTSSIEESSSTSEYDPYIDTVISNIKKYIKDVGDNTIGASLTVKEIYSISTYVESESTHLIYGFTISEDTNRYIRFDINLEQELNEEEIVDLIHGDNISTDLFDEQHIYEIIDEDITSKDTFKDVYPGSYTHHICYEDEYGYYMSGIGHHDEAYISIDLLSFDKDTYDIDDTDTSINQSNDINKKYYQLLEMIIG